MKALHYIHEHKVWVKMPRSEALRKGYNVVTGRCIDIITGVLTNRKYRSRYVAKEFNTGDLGGLFAPTPPLEALMLVPREGDHGEGRVS